MNLGLALIVIGILVAFVHQTIGVLLVVGGLILLILGGVNVSA